MTRDEAACSEFRHRFLALALEDAVLTETGLEQPDEASEALVPEL